MYSCTHWLRHRKIDDISCNPRPINKQNILSRTGRTWGVRIRNYFSWSGFRRVKLVDSHAYFLMVSVLKCYLSFFFTLPAFIIGSDAGPESGLNHSIFRPDRQLLGFTQNLRKIKLMQQTLFFKNRASVKVQILFVYNFWEWILAWSQIMSFCQAWEGCPRPPASCVDPWTRPENAGVSADRHLGRTWCGGQPPAPPSQRTGKEHQLAAILGAPGVVGSRQPLLASGQIKSTSLPPSLAHLEWWAAASPF